MRKLTISLVLSFLATVLCQCGNDGNGSSILNIGGKLTRPEAKRLIAGKLEPQQCWRGGKEGPSVRLELLGQWKVNPQTLEVKLHRKRYANTLRDYTHVSGADSLAKAKRCLESLKTGGYISSIGQYTEKVCLQRRQWSGALLTPSDHGYRYCSESEIRDVTYLSLVATSKLMTPFTMRWSFGTSSVTSEGRFPQGQPVFCLGTSFELNIESVSQEGIHATVEYKISRYETNVHLVKALHSCFDHRIVKNTGREFRVKRAHFTRTDAGWRMQ